MDLSLQEKRAFLRNVEKITKALERIAEALDRKSKDDDE